LFLIVVIAVNGRNGVVDQPHLPGGVANGTMLLQHVAHVQNGRGVADTLPKPSTGRGYSRGRGRSAVITTFPRQPAQWPIGRGAQAVSPTGIHLFVDCCTFALYACILECTYSCMHICVHDKICSLMP